jgi:hypothetical protein
MSRFRLIALAIVGCSPVPSELPPPAFPPEPPTASPGVGGGAGAVAPEPEDPPEPPQQPGPRPIVTAIALGADHACARIDDGTARCWGANHSGQLGDGTRRHREIPVAVRGLDHVKELVLGDRHTCALLVSGTVKCWGSSSGGQLGDGTFEDRRTPVDVRLLYDVKQLALGEDHSCALDGSGNVSCWGQNTCGQLGNGERYLSTGLARPRLVPGLGPVAEIAAAGRHTCARLRDDSVVCWGGNDAGELGSATRDKDPYARTRMSAPASFPAADVRVLGTSWAPCPASSRPTLVAGLSAPAGAKELALGDRHSCARLGDGSVRCWGVFDSRHGSPLRVPPPDQYLPRALPLATDSIRIASNGNRTCALRRDGSVVCLSDGRATKIVTDLPPATALAVGGDRACVLTGGDVMCWGERPPSPVVW